MEFTATEREMTTTAAREREARLKEQQEVSMLAQQSREGYFGETGATMASNATGEPRIVLDEQYGGGEKALPNASLAALGLDDAHIESQLRGCAGRYADRVVIVTGGARGIGEGCVRVFYEAGASVVVCDRDEVRGAALAEELNNREWDAFDAGSGRAAFAKADVSVGAARR